MLKIGAAEVNQTLMKAASVIRSLKAENDELKVRLAAGERDDHAEKIASIAVERGILAPDEAEEYAKGLSEGDKDLSMVEDLVKRTAAGAPLAESLQKVASEDGQGEGEPDVLTSFLLNSNL